MQRIILSFIVLVCFSGDAATINIACDYSALTNAVLTTAQEGDTVMIAPGSCTITAQITINRNISFTIAGSGSNATHLVSAALDQAIWVESNSANTFTIRDLDFVGHSPNGGSFLIMGHPAFDSPGPFHVYNIQMTNVIGRGIGIGRGKSKPSYGLIDHVYGVAVAGYAQMLDFQGAVYGSWTNTSNPIGTTNVCCAEDCHFVTDPSNLGGNGFFDSYNGASVVFRHNLCEGYSPIGGHGYDSGDSGVRTWEIYNNTFTNIGNSSIPTIAWRGGSGVIFSNKVYGSSSVASMAYYRCCPDDHPYGTVTGFLLTGKPGTNYTMNFNGTIQPHGLGTSYPSNPTNGQEINIGFTFYTFVSPLNNATFNMANKSGFGGGAVLIGSTAAETISNLFQAVNVVPAGYGTSYSNWSGLPYPIGHDFIAMSYNSTNLYLTNALDGNADAFGHPAYQQIGVITAFPITGTNFVQNQSLWPAYAWSNTLNGSLTNFVTLTDTCGNYITNLVKLNRDYFDGVVPSGATYTPLVYPHPLQAGESGGGGGGSSAGIHVTRANIGRITAAP